MAEIIHDGKTKFAVPLHRAVLRDSRLSFGARGLFVFLWDLPSGWKIRIVHLAKMAPEGRAAIRSRLQELEDVGAVIIEHIQRKDGLLNGKRWILVHPAKWAIEAQLTDDRKTRSSVEPNFGGGATKDLQGRRTCKKEAAGAATFKRRYGDERIIHGIEVWTDTDKRGINQLVDQYGAEVIEEVAATVQPAPGHVAPYLSSIRRALCDREAKARSEEAEARRTHIEEEFIKNAPQDELTAEQIAKLPPTLRERAKKSMS